MVIHLFIDVSVFFLHLSSTLSPPLPPSLELFPRLPLSSADHKNTRLLSYWRQVGQRPVDSFHYGNTVRPASCPAPYSLAEDCPGYLRYFTRSIFSPLFTARSLFPAEPRKSRGDGEQTCWNSLQPRRGSSSFVHEPECLSRTGFRCGKSVLCFVASTAVVLSGVQRRLCEEQLLKAEAVFATNGTLRKKIIRKRTFRRPLFAERVRAPSQEMGRNSPRTIDVRIEQYYDDELQHGDRSARE